MDREFLRSTQFTKENILQNVLAPNNFNGELAQRDLEKLVREDKARQFSKKLFYFSNAGILFSLFNVTRIGQLSPSGKPAALFGLAFFSVLSYSSLARSGTIGHHKETTEAPAAEVTSENHH